MTAMRPSMPDTHAAEPIPAAAEAEIARLLASGDLFRYSSEDAPVALLEAEFAALMGTKYALAVASCSAALFLSMKALGLPRGAKVGMPAFTFGAVPSSIVHADCVPVLIECGANYRLCLDDLEAKIGSLDALLVSHMRGHTSDMDHIMAAAERAGVPVIEDAAHSLGTVWRGRKIGTIGRVGCFSFQSYKLVNAGEGGIMISDDADLIARAVIMSGAYEHNWKKHPVLQDAFAKWQNQLPLYNTRLSNLSAAVIRPQLAELPRRMRDGLAGHDQVAERLNTSPWLEVPPPLPGETRAPDSIQFNLIGGWQDDQVRGFVAAAKERGVGVQVFGLTENNARAFWNWQFLPGEVPELPRTKAMLMRACDVRLPARLTEAERTAIADALLAAVQAAAPEPQAIAV